MQGSLPEPVFSAHLSLGIWPLWADTTISGKTVGGVIKSATSSPRWLYNKGGNSAFSLVKKIQFDGPSCLHLDARYLFPLTKT